MPKRVGETPLGASSQQRAVIAGIAGNVMEWYDFSVYGYFATVIGRHFFPAQDATSSLVMAVPTFLIGILPTYQQIGLLAPVLLVLLRLVQGLSVGGEYTTSSIFLVERAEASHRGILGSLVPLGATGGVLLGSAVGAAVTTALNQAAVNSWGWRLAFLLGLLVGGIGFAIRRQLADDRAAPGGMPPAASPVHDAFLTQWRTILRVVGLNAAGAVAYYMTFVYVTTYLRQVDFVTASKALDINTIAVLALMLAIVPMGRLSDRIGRRPVLLAATGGLFVLAVPLFWMLHHTNPAVLLIGQIGFAVLNAAYWGPSTATMVELVPGHIRCTVMSVGYNLGLAILGGATPMVAVYVVHRSDNDLSPAFLILAAAAVSFLVILGLRESNKATLARPASPPTARIADSSG